MPASGAVPYGQQRELLVISRALGIDLLEFFVEITKQPGSEEAEVACAVWRSVAQNMLKMSTTATDCSNKLYVSRRSPRPVPTIRGQCRYREPEGLQHKLFRPGEAVSS